MKLLFYTSNNKSSVCYWPRLPFPARQHRLAGDTADVIAFLTSANELKRVTFPSDWMRVVLGNSNCMRTSKWRDRKKTHQLCPGSGAPQSSMICIDQTFGDRNPNHDTVVMRQEDQEPDFTNEDHYKIVIKEENQDPDSTDQVGIEEEQDTDFIVLGLEEDQEEEPLSTGPQQGGGRSPLRNSDCSSGRCSNRRGGGDEGRDITRISQ